MTRKRLRKEYSNERACPASRTRTFRHDLRYSKNFDQIDEISTQSEPSLRYGSTIAHSTWPTSEPISDPVFCRQSAPMAFGSVESSTREPFTSFYAKSEDTPRFVVPQHAFEKVRRKTLNAPGALQRALRRP